MNFDDLKTTKIDKSKSKSKSKKKKLAKREQKSVPKLKKKKKSEMQESPGTDSMVVIKPSQQQHGFSKVAFPSLDLEELYTQVNDIRDIMDICIEKSK